MRMISPVIAPALSISHSAASATSAGMTARRSGNSVSASRTRSAYSSSLRIFRVQLPSSPPGQSVLTLTSGASSRAKEMVRVLSAPFEAQYAIELPAARQAARRFADRWQGVCPPAVDCLRNDLDELFACFRYDTLAERKAVRTTNAIERRFREVRRRTRPMGVFQDRTSMDRILFAVFTHENATQGVPALFSLTQTI